MIRSFGDKATQDIYDGKTSRAALTIQRALWERIRVKLDMLDAARTLEDVKSPPSNRLEKLRGTWDGFYSIRVNEQFRIVFRFAGGDCLDVQVVDYH